jgi:hypothetical protein
MSIAATSGLLLMLLATPALAQAPMAEPAACPAPIAPTGPLAPWSAPTPIRAGADGAHATALTGGKAALVDLLPTPAVTYPLPPEKPGGAESHGGVLALDVAQAGTWRVALGAGAWLDVVGADGAQRSTAHAHGPTCSGIRKMVDFALKPGHYILQISASGAARVEVLAVTLP